MFVFVEHMREQQTLFIQNQSAKLNKSTPIIITMAYQYYNCSRCVVTISMSNIGTISISQTTMLGPF